MTTRRALKPGRALITGAARRLGRAMALGLAADGWAVALHYSGSAADASKALGAVKKAGAPDAALLQADFTNEEQTSELVERASAALDGSLTLLINNASTFERDEAASVTRESWDRHMEVNLRAPFVLSQSFAAQAPEADTLDGEPISRAMIVNMLDTRVLNLTPHFTSYTLSKAGLATMTQTLAMALGPRVRVNGIAPGPALPAKGQSREHFAGQRAATALGRGADPEDVVAALRWLIAAPSTTGQILALDGGQHLNWRGPPRS